MIPPQIRSAGIARKPGSAQSRGEAVAFVGAFILPLGLFAVLAAGVAAGEHGWDSDILRFSGRYYKPSIATPLEETLKISIGVGAAIVVAALVVLLVRKRRAQALFWALAVGGVVAFELPLKEIFRRPPIGDHGGGYSFPSGNAMASVAIVAVIALTSSGRWRKRTLAVGVPLVVAYGVILIYQWWHYPSDIVAGWCLALAWVTGLWLVLRRTASFDCDGAGNTGPPPSER